MLDKACLQDRFNAAMERFQPFEDHPHVAVAVSGGADSLALAILAQNWALSHGGTCFGLMIDHRMRAASSDELSLAAQQLDRFGIAHRKVVWRGIKPEASIQERARDARYRLLAAEAKQLGILHLLLGHHIDDQIETIAMREARQPNHLGLSGMTAVRLVDEVRILRPLLQIRKSDLTTLAHDRGVATVDDPSNHSPRFERGRLRLNPIPDPGRLAALGDQFGAKRIKTGEAVATLLASCCSLTSCMSLILDCDDPTRIDLEVLEGTLKKCLTTVRGITTRPALRAAHELALRIQRGERTRMTLGGCIVMIDRGPVRICREPGRISDQSILHCNKAVRWDSRFIFQPERLALGLKLARAPFPSGRLKFEKLERAAMPALWSGEDCLETLELEQPSRFGALRAAPSRVLVEPPFVV